MWWESEGNCSETSSTFLSSSSLSWVHLSLRSDLKLLSMVRCSSCSSCSSASSSSPSSSSSSLSTIWPAVCARNIWKAWTKLVWLSAYDQPSSVTGTASSITGWSSEFWLLFDASFFTALISHWCCWFPSSCSCDSFTGGSLGAAVMDLSDWSLAESTIIGWRIRQELVTALDLHVWATECTCTTIDNRRSTGIGNNHM